MKSTYELLGIHLDGLPLPQPPLSTVHGKETVYIPEIDEEYSLLDCLKHQRKISGMKLLSTVSFEAMVSLINPQCDCESIVI